MKQSITLGTDQDLDAAVAQIVEARGRLGKRES
jgi:hypothetical protein